MNSQTLEDGEYVVQLLEVFLESLSINDDIVHVCPHEVTVGTKDMVDLSLHVWRRVLISYYSYLELFLASMRYYCELVTVIPSDCPLVEEGCCICSGDVAAALDCCRDVTLQWYRIRIHLSDVIEASNIDNNPPFSFRFFASVVYGLPYHKYRVAVSSWLRSPFHLALFV